MAAEQLERTAGAIDLQKASIAGDADAREINSVQVDRLAEGESSHRPGEMNRTLQHKQAARCRIDIDEASKQ